MKFNDSIYTYYPHKIAHTCNITPTRTMDLKVLDILLYMITSGFATTHVVVSVGHPITY